ncbi:MAG TPA: UDP-N-acetylmuramoyl-L-alanyl-D-glutamate--2,6-diaminopimelate ligase, partial [Gemmatimonadaceae bacterium]|nr:UDP-N-acetylmuramoyl-L-alanyl-D-glutamate--2,6-diaminopimelate ligase [Gemmatimonadaceae bacterium]
MTEFRIERVAEALANANLLVEMRGELPAIAHGITDDSRAVQPGVLFVAVRGSAKDGHDFLSAAAERGATAAIVEDASRTTLPALVVRDGRRAAAIAAAAVYGEPVRDLRLLAVTGTNGKTTTVGILRHLLDEESRRSASGSQAARSASHSQAARSASIGTLGVLIGSEGVELPGGSGLTTPGPIELQRVLRALVDAGVRTVAMEVSSHSLDQRRVEGLRFAAGVFTNLTRDHLDYHGTMEHYLAAKAKLVEYLEPGGAGVVNADDPAWDALPPAPRTIRFSAGARVADVYARRVTFSPRGSEWTLHAPEFRPAKVRLPLIGDFNVANAVGAAAAAFAVGVPVNVIAERLSTLPQVPGRLEMIGERPTVLRDYAHTPDALERALDAVRPFATRRLIVVFGCGGDRDRGKRPEMGAIAERKADLAVLTSDNPRTEDPARILDDVEAGMTGTNHLRVEDRREAIANALATASPDDVVVLAGKGHETYQIRGTTKYPFDEKAIVRELMAEGVAGS